MHSAMLGSSHPNTIYEVGLVTIADLKLRRSIGGSNAAEQNLGTGPRDGSLANPSASLKSMFRNTEVKARLDTMARSLGRSMVYKM